MVVRLALTNTHALAPAAIVSSRFGIPLSTLRGWKSAEKVIAIKPPGAARELYPLVQFSKKSVAPWAAQIISVLGKGAPAFHFLMVPRKSLSRESYSDRILKNRASAANLINSGLSIIEVE